MDLLTIHESGFNHDWGPASLSSWRQFVYANIREIVSPAFLSNVLIQYVRTYDRVRATGFFIDNH